MMITILGFPPKTKYQDVKILIKQECNINDFILDNLVNDSAAVGTKKVRIGLTDNAEGYKVIKCLDGYRMPGNYILKAMPVGKPATNTPTQGAFDTNMGYQDHPRNDYSAAPRNDYMGQSNNFNSQVPHGSGMHSSAPHVARPTHGQGGHSGQMDMNRPSPWATGNNSNQWNAGPTMASQVPQNTFGGFNSPQANINNPYGQQPQQNPVHSRPDMRPGFNQARTHTEQTYGGYQPKSNIPEVPENSRYRWFRTVETETPLPELPSNTNDPQPLNPSSNESTSNPVEDEPTSVNDLKDDTVSESTGNNIETEPSETKINKKAKKREEAMLRDLSKISSTCRRRLYWWMKRGKTFMEARALCEKRYKSIPEYAAAKKEKKIQDQQKALRKLDPEKQARAERFQKIINKADTKTGIYICIRITDTQTTLSEEQLDKLQDKVLELVEEEKGEMPSISGCTAKYGALKLAFTNEQSVKWLEAHLPDLHLWEGASLRLINMKENRPAVGVAYIPDPTLDENSIITILKEENPRIDFSNWWITHTKRDSSNGISVTFAVDQNSVPALFENNCIVYMTRRRIKIRIKSKFVRGQNEPKRFGPQGSSYITPELMDQWYSTPLEHWYPGSMGGIVKGPIPQMVPAPMEETALGPSNIPFYLMAGMDQYNAPSFSQTHNFGGGNKNKAYERAYNNMELERSRWNDYKPRHNRGTSNNNGSGKFGGSYKYKGQQHKSTPKGGSTNYIKPGTYIRPGSNKPGQDNKSGNNNRPGKNNKPGNRNSILPTKKPGENNNPGSNAHCNIWAQLNGVPPMSTE